MAVSVDVPGWRELDLQHLLLDQNGTFSDRGELIPGVAERLERLRDRIAIHVLSADTFGTLDQLGPALGVDHHRVGTGAEKREFLDRLGAAHCAAVGNGRNDVEMLSGAGLAIAVLGPEGMCGSLLSAAHIVCRSIVEALDLLLDARVLVATLRV